MAEGVISRRGSEFASIGLKRTLSVRRTFNVGQGEPVDVSWIYGQRGSGTIASSMSSVLRTVTLNSTQVLTIYTTAGNTTGTPTAVISTLNKSNGSTSSGTVVNLQNLLTSLVAMNNADWGRNFSAVKLNDGRILLSFTGNPTAASGSWRTMYAILSISGTTITMSGAGILNNTLSADTTDRLSASQVLDDNRVLWLYTGGNTSISNRPVASVLTISGNVVTTSGTNFVLDSVSTQTGLDLKPIADGRFLATFVNSSAYATILVLLVTEPNIITMGTSFIVNTNTVFKSSNKVEVPYTNIGILAYPQSSPANYQMGRYRIDGANLIFLGSVQVSSLSTSSDGARPSKVISLQKINNGIFHLSTFNQGSGGLHVYDSNFVNYFSSSGWVGLTQLTSPQLNTVDTNYLGNNSVLEIFTSGSSSSSMSVLSYHFDNPGLTARPAANYPESRAFTTHAATSEQDVDIIVAPTSSQNPFNVI
jgi:hypothetical protein